MFISSYNTDKIYCLYVLNTEYEMLYYCITDEKIIAEEWILDRQEEIMWDRQEEIMCCTK